MLISVFQRGESGFLPEGSEEIGGGGKTADLGNVADGKLCGQQLGACVVQSQPIQEIHKPDAAAFMEQMAEVIW